MLKCSTDYAYTWGMCAKIILKTYLSRESCEDETPARFVYAICVCDKVPHE